jgi:hypothetical protein
MQPAGDEAFCVRARMSDFQQGMTGSSRDPEDWPMGRSEQKIDLPGQQLDFGVQLEEVIVKTLKQGRKPYQHKDEFYAGVSDPKPPEVDGGIRAGAA